MGEQADLILEGVNCQYCGCFICEEGPGHTQLCAGCEQEAEFDDEDDE